MQEIMLIKGAPISELVLALVNVQDYDSIVKIII